MNKLPITGDMLTNQNEGGSLILKETHTGLNLKQKREDLYRSNKKGVRKLGLDWYQTDIDRPKITLHAIVTSFKPILILIRYDCIDRFFTFQKKFW